MSDSDDWENYVDESDEKLEERLKAQDKFGDEQTAPVEAKPEPVQVSSAPKKRKEKIGEKFDKKQEERKKEMDPIKAKLENRKREEEADHDLTEMLFQTERVEVLNTEQEYLDYTSEVSKMLAKGKSHFRLPVFFKELLKDMGGLMNSTQIAEVISTLNTLHRDKLKQEKGPTKAKKNKQTLKGVDKRGGALLDLNDDEDFHDQMDEYADFM